MATRNFTITYAAGSSLKLAVFRVSDGYVLDFNDNTFKSTIGGATTPYSSATEVTNAGGSLNSLYKVALDLSHVNSSGTSADFVIDWYTDTGLTTIVSESEFISVVSSDIDFGTAPTAASIRSEIDSNSTQLAAIKAKTDNLPSSPAAVGSAMTLSSNAITTAAIQDGAITDAKFTVPTVSGVSTGVLSMIVQLWRRFFKKTTCTATELKTFANDGTTVLTTQTVGESAGTQTVSEAT